MMPNTTKSVTNILDQKPPPTRGDRPSIFDQWYPIGIVFPNVILSTTAEVLLKIGVNQPSSVSFPAPLSLISILASSWVQMGIIAYIASLFLWLIALRRLPLHIAYGLASSVHLLVPLASWLVLHETVPLGRISGMLFILVGIVLLGFSRK